MRGMILLAALPLLFDVFFAWGLTELGGAPAETPLPRTRVSLPDWDHVALPGHPGWWQAALLAHPDRAAQTE